MEETESIVDKTKNFISNNKGKLALLAGAGTLYYMHNRGLFGDAAGWLGDHANKYSQDQHKLKEQLAQQENKAQQENTVQQENKAQQENTVQMKV